MSKISGKDKEQIGREALDWLIALQEESDNEDVHARFLTWLSTSPMHIVAWTEAQHTWRLLEEALPRTTVHQFDELQKSLSSFPAGQILQGQPQVGRSLPHLSAVRLSPSRWHPVTIAATTLAVVVLFLVLLSFQRYLQADYVSSTGERRQLQLEDGSVVQLGPGSAMSVAYDPQMRRISILAGEAFFEVAPDVHRPFLVTSGQLEATVVGTAFNVHFSPTRSSIAVRQGTVRVSSHNPSLPFEDYLHSGEWVQMAWNEKTFARGVIPPEQVAVWLQGRLLVKNWTISEVVAELDRYHHGLIVLTDGRIGNKKVTGVYDLRKPIESLRAVAQPYALVVREATPYLVFLSPF